MFLKKEPKLSKRLERLVKSGIRPGEDSAKYASELRALVHRIIDEKTMKLQSRLFKALADTTRLKIMMLLDIREMCVCEIMTALELTQPTASHHLGLLEAVDLIKDRREGKWIFYSLKRKKIVNMIRKFH